MTNDEMMQLRMNVPVLIVLISSFIIRHSLCSAEPASHIPAAFLQTYCIDCHGAEKQKGDRRFDQLSLPAKSADDLVVLQEIIDQLNLGDMPPKKARQPG